MFKDILGEKFGRLTVISVSPEKTRGGEVRWDCICDCGRIVSVRGSALRGGHTRSCGCLQRERVAEASYKHGMSGTKIWEVWEGMKGRCYRGRDDNCKNYRNYTKRGIYICGEWLEDPSRFIRWAERTGYSPGLQIDRIDNNGPYSPGNCRWATREEQARNKRNNHTLTYEGKTQCIAEWSLELGIPITTIVSRLKYGYSEEKALSLDCFRGKTRFTRKSRSLLYQGRTQTIKEWAVELGLHLRTIYDRLGEGRSVEEALSTSRLNARRPFE